MNKISYKIGYWSSILILIAFIIWIVSFLGIAISSPLFYWTNLSDYIIYFKANNHFFQNLAMIFMLLFGPLYILLINSYYDYVADNRKVLVRISLLFALAFGVLSSLHYFVQLGSVRINMESGNFEGIEHFVQANPVSIMTSVLMLGWTLFLGLSSLFIFPVFSGKGVVKWIRYAFLINGLSCFIAGIGYLFQVDILTFIFVNMGVGAAVMTIAISSIKLFRQLMKIKQ